MCSFAGSHEIVSDGLLFDSPVGSRTDVLTLVDGGHAPRDVVEPGEPRLPFGFVIALHPRLDRRQHPERFFAADLVVAARTVVRRARLPRRHQNVLAAEQQAGALRPADRFAAAVGDDRWRLSGGARSGSSAPRRPHRSGSGCSFGFAILATFSSDSGPDEAGRRSEIDHRRARTQRVLELFRRVDRDHLHADVADRVIVDVARGSRR